MIAAGTYGALILGLSTSVGPCAAPRYLGLLGAIAETGGARRWLGAFTFICGLATSYAALASLGFLFASALTESHLLYLGLGAGFCAGGVSMALVRHECDHRTTGHRIGKPFLAGVASGLVVSPCCTPIVLQGGLMAASGSVAAAASMLFAFLTGHIAPIGFAGASGSIVLNRVKSRSMADAVTAVAAGCTIALGLYYGCSA